MKYEGVNLMSHLTLSNWENKNFALYFDLNGEPKKIRWIRIKRQNLHVINMCLVLSSFLY